MASRLSEDSGRTVLLVEAGPVCGSYVYGKWPADLLNASNLALDSHGWGFEDSSAARARVIGGCSSANACLVALPPPGDYARWANMEIDGWDFAAQLPLMQGCVRVGYPKLSNLNGPEWRPGVALAPRHVFEGVRWNAALAYLDVARAQTNLTILSDCIVDRVLIKNSKVMGVAVLSAEGVREIFSDTVILSAGSYMSPTLLQRSGFGPSDLLQKLGIDLLCKLEGVGKDLGDHSGASIQYEMGVTSHLPTNGLPEVILHSRSSLALDQYWDSQTLIWHSGEIEASTLNFAHHAMESDSKGWVQALSPDPNVLPEIEQPWSNLSKHDLQLLAIIGIQVELAKWAPALKMGQPPNSFPRRWERINT